MNNENWWIIGEIDNADSNQLLSELFSDNSMLKKEGPFSRSIAVEKFERFRVGTFPLYVATKDNINYYLFY